MTDAQAKAATLIEALPYLQHFRGETFLIKIGGSVMEDPQLVSDFMRDILFLEAVGINPVLVHGGGKAISAAMAESGLEPTWVNGFRVTCEKSIELVEKTLTHTLSPHLVGLLNKHEGRGIAIPGTEVFQATRMTPGGQDIGFVGEVASCLIEQVEAATARSVVPVISPLGRELDTGQALNINADLAAAALAKALKPAKLIYLSDVPGLLRDPKDASTLIPSLNPTEADGYIADGTIAGGMIPKVTSALDALQAGTRKVHFIDGRLPHVLLLEIFTSQGIGTEIVL
ncbi:acetylglutamate kinase [Roseibacillus ishigakijimensis]|uniref:Acetylglutamate kinase n=1 Tax=Roseibacillus ishigakijimensis TaxID=454146 RepID=A0A934VL44_9BACT|nr:acetylglutamate kinase [Roseibacillus ishigakijimensis]MBK1832490.1 acetylglutamate kinase [Roseibacillus ishigakijimensis]